MKLLLVVLLLLSVVLFNFCGHPNDAELESLFRSKRSDFELLVAMLNEDRAIIRLSDTSIFYSDVSKRIPNTRIVEYRNLLTRLQLSGGIHRDDGNSIRLIVSTRGVPLMSSEKSILFSDVEPEPLFDSLDQLIETDPGDTGPVFKKLDSHWYFMYESW